jgi:non-heme Fe2+,alpha-ketoglutarate-dependent halogenase
MQQRWKPERLRLLDRKDSVYRDLTPESGIYNYDRHLDNAFLAELVTRPEIVRRLASIMGPNLLCWRSEFFPKYPGDEGSAWHQADTFGGLNGVPHIKWPNGSAYGGALTAWIAFTDAQEDTSCMQFIPGTQGVMNYDESRGMRYDPDLVNKKEVDGVKRGFYGYDWREIQIDPDWKPDETKAVSVPCKAGEFLLFWSTLMHASTPHKGLSAQMRLAFAARYIPTSVKVYDGMSRVTELGGTLCLEHYGTVLVAGVDSFAHNRVRTHTTKGKPFMNALPAATIG